MADSDNEDAPQPRRQLRAAAVEAEVEPAQPRSRQRRAAPVEDAPVEAEEPAQPRRRQRRAAAVVEPEEEQDEEASGAPAAPVRRSARRAAAKSPAAKRKNLREARRVLAEQGINSENAREGGEEREAEGGEDQGDEAEGGKGEGGGGGGPLGVLGAMIKGTVNYLKTDPYQNAFGDDTSEEPYPSLKELYETVKENPNSAEIQRQTMSDFRTLKQSYHDSGCDTDIDVTLNPKCIGIQAGLYMRLFDIRKSINESLEQMRPIQQQAVLARINREARPEYNGEDDVFVPAGV